LINISGKIDKTTIELYNAVNQAVGSLDIPFVVVGGSARDIMLHYACGAKIQRATMDIDFGIQARDWNTFTELKEELIKAGFTETKTRHRLLSPSKMQVDIMPFGHVEDEESNINWPHSDEKVMKVLGFQEACDNAEIVRIQDNPSVDIPVATPAGIALLKIIAWMDREINNRKKDAKDLSYLINTYDQIPAIKDGMYKDEDLMNTYAWDTTLVGAYFLGKDTGKIAFEKTRKVIQDLFNEKINGLHPERLVEEMCNNIELDFDRKDSLFKAFMTGFNCSDTY
jgi:predicted nucleotidyltransferase